MKIAVFLNVLVRFLSQQQKLCPSKKEAIANTANVFKIDHSVKYFLSNQMYICIILFEYFHYHNKTTSVIYMCFKQSEVNCLCVTFTLSKKNVLFFIQICVHKYVVCIFDCSFIQFVEFLFVAQFLDPYEVTGSHVFATTFVTLRFGS